MENQKHGFTPLSTLGEFGVIRHLTAGILPTQSSTIKGIGDDAAILDYSNKRVVVTTDLLTEGIHFNLVYAPLKHLGYKAAMVNFSDLFAMNAIPRQLLISLAVSAKFSLEHLDELYQGMLLACSKHQVDLVGGDTNSSLTGPTISITALGDAAPEDPVYRSTARAGDLVCVSGDLGAAYLGLQVLEREKKLFQENSNFQPSLQGYDYVLERQLKPEARGDIIELLRRLNLMPTSMIDISDGLSSEVLHICTDSGVGCKIYEDKIPIDQDTVRVAEELNLEPLTCAMNGGEDYELLFTLPLKDYELIRRQPKMSVIGHICKAEEGINLITQAGASIPLKAQGWNGMQ